jgi:hypothetical protein
VPTGKRGRKQSYGSAAIQMCPAMKVLSGMAIRQTTGLSKAGGVANVVEHFERRLQWSWYVTAPGCSVTDGALERLVKGFPTNDLSHLDPP